VEVYADYSFFLCRNQFYICLYLLCNWDRTFRRLQVQTVNGEIWASLFFWCTNVYHCWLWSHQSLVLTSALSAAEALIGLLSFAIATGFILWV
jgi:hypothetical protein